jgi:hypothetical protein
MQLKLGEMEKREVDVDVVAGPLRKKWDIYTSPQNITVPVVLP